MCEARVSETRSRVQTWSGPLRKSTGFVGLAPTVGQLRAATSAATGESLETEADLVVLLRVAGWGVGVRPDRRGPRARIADAMRSGRPKDSRSRRRMGTSKATALRRTPAELLRMPSWLPSLCPDLAATALAADACCCRHGCALEPRAEIKTVADLGDASRSLAAY